MSRNKQRSIFPVSLLISLLIAAPVAAQGAMSKYLTFDIDKCPAVKKDEESGAVTLHCKHPSGYQIYVSDADVRITMGFGPKGMKQRSHSQSLNPFNNIHNVLELRYFPGAAKPHAAIVRYHTNSGMGDGVKGQVLVVTKLAGEEACQIAHIDALANKDANELARQSADTAADFDCARDEPKIIGQTGKSPM
jgi:hypothetical protein